MPDKAHISQR